MARETKAKNKPAGEQSEKKRSPTSREKIYKAQLEALGIYEPAFDPLIKDLAKAERRRTRAEKEWAKTAPPGGKPSFLDPHYQVVAALDREILGYREVMGLTPKSLRRLRGVPEAAVDSDPITERLDRIAARVDSYSALPSPADPYAGPEAHSLEPEEAQAYAEEQAQAWNVLNLDTDGAP